MGLGVKAKRLVFGMMQMLTKSTLISFPCVNQHGVGETDLIICSKKYFLVQVFDPMTINYLSRLTVYSLDSIYEFLFVVFISSKLLCHNSTQTQPVPHSRYLPYNHSIQTLKTITTPPSPHLGMQLRLPQRNVSPFCHWSKKHSVALSSESSCVHLGYWWLPKLNFNGFFRH